jgi:hypothetical protein
LAALSFSTSIRFPELGDGAEYLANEAAGTVVVTARQVHAIAGEDAAASLRELAHDDFLHHQVTRQTVRALHDDHASDGE